MRSGRRTRLLSALLPAALLLQTAGCERGVQQAPAAGNEVAAQQSSSAPVANPLMQAAEPFEVLTEQAFTVPWDRLDTLIGEAAAALQNAAGSLQANASAAAERQMSAVRRARGSQDRIGIALGAVETYRTLVEAQDATSAHPPIPVSLLDYAGFRYDALAQAPNPDWAEMRRLTGFAREQWQQIAPNISSRALQGVVSTALDGMSSAAERRDVASARAAAAVELALVDLIEEQVARPGGVQPQPASAPR